MSLLYVFIATGALMAEEVPLRSFLTANCTDCHSAPSPEGELDLETLPAEGDDLASLIAWDRVRARLGAGDMPPRADRRPERAQYDAALRHVERVIDQLATHHDDPGAPAARRLNRSEWFNAVRDLLGVEIDIKERLPADEIGHGFDTVGDTLSLTPMMLEKFLDAAELAAMRTIQDPDDPILHTWSLQADELDIVGHAKLNRGTVHMWSRATASGDVDLPRDGRYRVRIHAHGRQAGEQPVRLKITAGDLDLGTIDVPERSRAEHDILVDLPGGPMAIGATFINDMYRPDHPDPLERDRNAAVDGIDVAGPMDEPIFTPFQAALPTANDDEHGARILRDMVADLLGRAWRRPVTEDEITSVADVAFAAGGTHEARLRAAIVTILVHPAFLLRLEADPPSGMTTRALNGHEIATRMAMFIWSSVPDDALHQAASSGDLDTTDGRREQVQRMLADDRSSALAENFASQWLQVRRLDVASPDPAMFPGADRRLLSSMQREPIALFDRVLREDRPWTDLLTSDRTTVDDVLATHYGMQPPEPGRTAEVRRGSGTGVLEHAAILTATSNPTRTSPVKRGKWVLEVLLDAPPPPPPPDIPPIPEDGRGVEPGSMRALFIQHREDPSCRTCHERMDELGFAFESFDAIGRPRDGIDDVGHPPGEAPLHGLAGVRDWILARGALPRSLARHMLTYAIGRGFDARDEAAIDQVADHLVRQQRLSSLLEAIVESRPFLHRGIPRSRSGDDS